MPSLRRWRTFCKCSHDHVTSLPKSSSNYKSKLTFLWPVIVAFLNFAGPRVAWTALDLLFKRH